MISRFDIHLALDLEHFSALPQIFPLAPSYPLFPLTISDNYNWPNLSKPVKKLNICIIQTSIVLFYTTRLTLSLSMVQQFSKNNPELQGPN